MQSINNNNNTDESNDKSGFTFAQSEQTVPVTQSSAFNNQPVVTAAGPLKFGGMQMGTNQSSCGGLKPTNTQSGAIPGVFSGAFGIPSTQSGGLSGSLGTAARGCCNPFPQNTQRHPETGQPIQQQTFSFGYHNQNLPIKKDKLIEDLYSELRRLQDHVNESNKLIGNMYEILRKL